MTQLTDRVGALFRARRLFLLLVLAACSAESGSDDGQTLFNRGAALYHGYGEIEANKKEGCRIFEEAAKLDNPNAVFGLANCHKDGDLGARDIDKAERLYLLAASQNVDDAFVSLGLVYLLESEDPGRHFAGNKFLEIAALRSDPAGIARFQLGVSSLVGRGTHVDILAAKGRFEQSAQAGYAFAIASLVLISCGDLAEFSRDSEECQTWMEVYSAANSRSPERYPELDKISAFMREKGWLSSKS